MIFRKLILENYGTFGGYHELNLSPASDELYNRPVIFIRGLNGAGKTTLVESIRVCLHGALAFGPRIGKHAYEETIRKRIHRQFGVLPAGNGAPTSTVMPIDTASVQLHFSTIEAGVSKDYEVKRSWRITEKHNVIESLHLTENGVSDTSLSKDQCERFLRDLISPTILDVFFFDGEKLQSLAKKEWSNTVLLEGVRSLLGLSIAEQLQKDLDVYVDRRLGEEAPDDIAEELASYQQELAQLERDRDFVLQESLTEKKALAENIREGIAHLEELIAKEGGEYAVRRDELSVENERLSQELELKRRGIIESFSGLLPFVFAPELCASVMRRLIQEEERSKLDAASDLIADRIGELYEFISSDGAWSESGIIPSDELRKEFIQHVNTVLLSRDDLEEHDVVLDVSETRRRKLISWISEVETEVGTRFANEMSNYLQIFKELNLTKSELTLVPSDEQLRQLVKDLNRKTSELEGVERKHDGILNDLGAVRNRIERVQGSISRLRKEFTGRRLEEHGLVLATRSKKALAEYVSILSDKKLDLFEDSIVRRFNELNRKDDLVSGVAIDRKSFQLQLFRGGKQYERDLLSEGEKQLLAISIIWALRDISGLPIPVIIDTPHGRLDGIHRANMIDRFLPRASHQVILLATDKEIDEEELFDLKDAISRSYELFYDNEAGRTVIREIYLDATVEA